MKELLVALVGVLMIAACYQAAYPVMEVRYNSSDNKTVDCYSEFDYNIPEGCSASVKPTVAQTWTQYLVILSTIGILSIGFTAAIRTRKKIKP